MSQLNSSVRNISDTALWVAYFRAKETKRADALFRDPYAERLAGELGSRIANSLDQGTKHEWAWVARTYLFDQFILQEIERGTDLVINLASGLDARPYRLELPLSLHWIEIDFPEVVSYKESILANQEPKCVLERIALDLLDEGRRRDFFGKVNREFRRILVVAEGLLIYFSPGQVASLATDLAEGAKFHAWVIDLASPGQLKVMQRTMGKQLAEGGAPFRFAPEEGVAFFTQYGWNAKSIRGLLKTASELNRAPRELLSLLPEPAGAFGNYPWTGVCLLDRKQ